ncbi:hypothetical protein QOT17_014146 [Balamuthia mandrillaris]
MAKALAIWAVLAGASLLCCSCAPTTAQESSKKSPLSLSLSKCWVSEEEAHAWKCSLTVFNAGSRPFKNLSLHVSLPDSNLVDPISIELDAEQGLPAFSHQEVTLSVPVLAFARPGGGDGLKMASKLLVSIKENDTSIVDRQELDIHTGAYVGLQLRDEAFLRIDDNDGHADQRFSILVVGGQGTCKSEAVNGMHHALSPAIRQHDQVEPIAMAGAGKSSTTVKVKWYDVAGTPFRLGDTPGFVLSEASTAKQPTESNDEREANQSSLAMIMEHLLLGSYEEDSWYLFQEATRGPTERHCNITPSVVMRVISQEEVSDMERLKRDYAVFHAAVTKHNIPHVILISKIDSIDNAFDPAYPDHSEAFLQMKKLLQEELGVSGKRIYPLVLCYKDRVCNWDINSHLLNVVRSAVLEVPRKKSDIAAKEHAVWRFLKDRWHWCKNNMTKENWQRLLKYIKDMDYTVTRLWLLVPASVSSSICAYFRASWKMCLFPLLVAFLAVFIVV